MPTLRHAAEEFLATQRIAVAGVSRDPEQPANLIYRRLRDSGHEVFAVNPTAEEVEDAPAYPSVGAIGAPVDGVVVVTPPGAVMGVVRDAVDAGCARVWLHRGLGPGSSSPEAVGYCREHGVSVIPGGCPNMFGACSDRGHRCMLAALQATGKLPREI